MANEIKSCFWKTESDCNGECTEQLLFGGQISVCICEAHLEEHRQVLFLRAHGKNIEEIMMLSPEERRKMFDEVRAEFPNEALAQ